jgi:hypothetical protein
LYNRCTGIYKFGNNTYSRCIGSRSNLGHIFRGKKCVLWVGKYSTFTHTSYLSKSPDMSLLNVFTFFLQNTIPGVKW